MNHKLLHTKELYDFVTGKASTAVARRLYRNLKEAKIEISAEQWSILYNLWEKEGRTQQELATLTFKDKPSITRLINKLEEQNMVIRVPHHTDNRINLIYLTKKGKTLESQCVAVVEQTLKESLLNVSEEEIQVCIAILKKVFLNLQ